ncbi:hypothetical protein WOLCODRAFT_20177 [Wolfiporia cocos MD-104 SS10]|uniref:Uncharacterized protein n=1 Tax=Wolfiporia cocos (strain MD-104) TaxID=742152 RepID=A0A2H3JII2_WOLCO|nr:hypothetical protein WOLCODRAFT_20177 [Wolfiporia cocos MD-104 SS10]
MADICILQLFREQTWRALKNAPTSNTCKLVPATEQVSRNSRASSRPSHYDGWSMGDPRIELLSRWIHVLYILQYLHVLRRGILFKLKTSFVSQYEVALDLYVT